MSEDPPPSERTRAAMLARHYRDHEHLAVGEIAQRLARTPATISAYLYDPTGAKTREVKRRYQGICETCGSPTWGAGPRHAGRLCARCNGRATLQWQPERIEAALRVWAAMFGRPATTTDLSLTHARKAAPKDGGERLRRLQAGWSEGRWPPASVVQYHHGTIAKANRIALAREPTGGEASD